MLSKPLESTISIYLGFYFNCISFLQNSHFCLFKVLELSPTQWPKEEGQTTQWPKEEGQTTQWPKEEGQTTQWPKEEGQTTQ